MVAYSFKRRFADAILAGTKRQTIRADRRRHARPGEELQLYTGMRTRQCRLIARRLCLSVEPIRLDFAGHRVEIGGTAIAAPAELDALAQADGFASWAELVAFWRDEHGPLDAFEGVLIRWQTTGKGTP